MSEQDEKAILESLREKAKSIDQKMLVVNSLIEDRERVLNEIGLGIEADIVLEGDEGYFLGFGKKTGTWAFYVRNGEDEARPLKSASRRVRMEAMMDENWIRLLREIDDRAFRFIVGTADPPVSA